MRGGPNCSRTSQERVEVAPLGVAKVNRDVRLEGCVEELLQPSANLLRMEALQLLFAMLEAAAMGQSELQKAHELSSHWCSAHGLAPGFVGAMRRSK